MTDEALVELGCLLRDFHEATASFEASGVTGWGDQLGRSGRGTVICHNDVFPENVVFRHGRPIALIDFDIAAPGRALWDVAIAAQVWGPLSDPAVRHDHPRDLDGVARLRLLARAYGVDPAEAAELVELIFAERASSLAQIRRGVADGDPTWVGYWGESGGEERVAADDAWLERQRQALVAAVALH